MVLVDVGVVVVDVVVVVVLVVDLYEEWIRLAETRLARNTSNYLKKMFELY